MEISDLLIFKAVILHGGITAAAQKLHRVQSNVTTRIQNLEAALNCQLFDRSGRRLELTPSGRILIDYADRIIDLAHEAKLALQSQEPCGALKLGAIEFAASTLLPATAAAFLEKHPKVHLEIQGGNSAELTQAVLHKQLDAAIVANAPKTDLIRNLALKTEEACLVSAKFHAPVHHAADLSSPTLLTFAEGCTFRALLMDWLQRGNVLPERMLTFSSTALILGCAAAGMGYALVPKSILNDYMHRDSLLIHPLNTSLSVTLQLIVRKTPMRSSALREWIHHFETAASNRGD
jgi:DNA-binding transcriptional LysR family regulator